MADEVNQYEEEYEPVSLRELLRSVRRQRWVILLSIGVILLLLAIALIGTYLLTPSERVASLAFRLEFQGAESRKYPSGVEFTTADIVAGPILRTVHEQNDLERFVPFREFSGSVYVVEENEDLRQLMNEYRAKLADAKLSAVDRARLEQEFAMKRESIARSSYTLNYAADVGRVQIPNDLVQKVLRDILETWSNYAREEKGAMRYQLPVLSERVLPPEAEEPMVALDMLRSRIWDIVRNIQTLRTIPGAEGLRTQDGMTLAELELRFDDIIRLYIRPLVNEFRAGRYAGDRQSAIRFVESQLDHVRIRRDDAAARVDALRQALALYSEGNAGPGAGMTQQASGAGETVILGDSFLDRIVRLSGLSEDRQYRQDLVDTISGEALKLVPYETEIEYYEQLLTDLQSSSSSTGSVSRSQRTIEQAREQVVVAVRQANEIYELASENLNASRLLYTITGPVNFATARSTSLSRLMLIGVLVLLIAIPAVLIVAVVLDRARDDDAVIEGSVRA